MKQHDKLVPLNENLYFLKKFIENKKLYEVDTPPPILFINKEKNETA